MKRSLLFILVLGLLSACGNGGIGGFFSGLFSSEKEAPERTPARIVKPAEEGGEQEKQATTLDGSAQKNGAEKKTPDAQGTGDQKAPADKAPAPAEKTAAAQAPPKEPPKSVTEKKAPAESPVPVKKETEPEKEVVEVYRYQDHSKTDPFLSPGDLTREKGGKLNVTLSGSREGEIDFSKFSFKATIQYGAEHVAVLEDSAGKGIILRVGEVFGGAKVISIDSERLVLRRLTVKNEDQSREIVLQRVKPEGGNQ